MRRGVFYAMLSGSEAWRVGESSMRHGIDGMWGGRNALYIPFLRTLLVASVLLEVRETYL